MELENYCACDNFHKYAISTKWIERETRKKHCEVKPINNKPQCNMIIDLT